MEESHENTGILIIEKASDVSSDAPKLFYDQADELKIKNQHMKNSQ